MIDTDKYEGHTVNRRDKLGTFAGTDIYVWTYFAQELPSWTSKADFLLVEDAPLLLAEYKKLRQFARLSNYSFSESLPELMQALVDERAEVKRLREELDEVYQERDKYEGALNIALEHLGYQGADHEWFCREKYQCNVYGDELLTKEEEE